MSDRFDACLYIPTLMVTAGVDGQARDGKQPAHVQTVPLDVDRMVATE